MHRWARALPSTLALLALLLAVPAPTAAAGPPFPDPVEGQSVYDLGGMLSPSAVEEIERLIDGMEAEVGAEMVVYTEHNPGISEGQNLDHARALMDQWGVGRRGFDDGVVLFISLDPRPGESRVSLYGGSGFVSSYASAEELQRIIDEVFVPRAVAGDREGAIVETVEAVTSRTSPEVRAQLERMRQFNAVLGLIGAPVALAGILFLAWRHWRRHGDDPELVDSPSVLMAGPPAGMTPALATVVREGRATQHTINTMLVHLAAADRIAFRNLDQVRSKRSDDEPDPLTDPAIVVNRQPGDDPLPALEGRALERIRQLGGPDGELRRSSLWKLNSRLADMKNAYEDEAVRLGWLTRRPTPQIMQMSAIAIGIGLIGAAVIWFGLSVPMSGATLLGGAIVLGATGTFGFARAMSQRTYQGAYVDAMLKAYRRTLAKTMEQARTIDEVVQEPEVAVLADTPDRAVVWAIALNLRDEVSDLIARGLEEQQRRTGSTTGAYYPAWLHSSSSGSWSAAGGSDVRGGFAPATGGAFAASGIPDIGGMFSALGSVGSTPPSSSSSSSGGGGFGGGGGGGGGGGSGSF